MRATGAENCLAGDESRRSLRNAAAGRQTAWWTRFSKPRPSILPGSRPSTIRPSWRSWSRTAQRPALPSENDPAWRSHGISLRLFRAAAGIRFPRAAQRHFAPPLGFRAVLRRPSPTQTGRALRNSTLRLFGDRDPRALGGV